MAYATAIRISDGLLGWAQSYNTIPDEDVIILNMGVNVLGGVSADYVYQDLTDQQNAAIEAAMPARSKLVGGVLTSATPITASLTAPTVVADGVATITLSINTNEAEYAGAVKVSVTPPDGSVATETLTASAGLASTTIATNQVGTHQVTMETVLQGLAFTSFEGV